MLESSNHMIQGEVQIFIIAVQLPNYLNVNFKASIQDAVSKAASPMATILVLSPSDET